MTPLVPAGINSKIYLFFISVILLSCIPTSFNTSINLSIALLTDLHFK